MKTFIPEGYQSILGVYDTQKGIGLLKRLFEDNLAAALNLHRVSAPLFVESSTGINDTLSGWERPVSFEIPAAESEAQVVQSLSKWKRMALKKYNFFPGKGLYADMNAIRRDEELDNIHSIYVDQWDWEKIITEEERSIDYLQKVVQLIVNAVCDTQKTMAAIFPELSVVKTLKREVSFITAQELLDMYPDLDSKGREREYLREYGTAFIIGIGDTLTSGEPHDIRAPDYDDWQLNGDILFWNEMLGDAIELSSMGIRVDPNSMDYQLRVSGCDSRRSLLFHSMLLNGELPLTIGGGIGQSRMCMLILGKAHIGEVQASVWDQGTVSLCEEAGIILL